MNQVLLAFATTLDLPDIGRCHHASDIVCPGATVKRYGRAKVHGAERGSFRNLGVAVIWGDDSRATRSLVNDCPDPIVVVCTPAKPARYGLLGKAITAVVESSRQCHVILPGDDEPLTVVRAGLGQFKVLHGEVFHGAGFAWRALPAEAPTPEAAEPVPDSPVAASTVADASVDAPE